MAKKYNRFRNYPLKKPINHTEYVKCNRSKNPGKILKEMGVLDENELRKMIKILKISVLSIFYLIALGSGPIIEPLFLTIL